MTHVYYRRIRNLLSYMDLQRLMMVDTNYQRSQTIGKSRQPCCRQRLENFQAEHVRMLEEKTGQEEAVQEASAKLEAIEEFYDDLSGRVSFRCPHASNTDSHLHEHLICAYGSRLISQMPSR